MPSKHYNVIISPRNRLYSSTSWRLCHYNSTLVISHKHFKWYNGTTVHKLQLETIISAQNQMHIYEGSSKRSAIQYNKIHN